MTKCMVILHVIFKHCAYSFEREHSVFVNLNLEHFLHYTCFLFSMPLPAQAVYANIRPWSQEATQSSDSCAEGLLATIPFSLSLPGHLVFHPL